jgi:hypothetical protein
MATTFKPKKITLSANDVATIQYIRSLIEPIVGRDTLTDIDVIRFCLNYFIKVDEAIEKVYDLLYKEVKENEKSKH